MQISSILRLRSAPPPVVGPLLEAPPPRLDFVAYGEDCLVSGATELIGSARLTDMLNRHDGVELASVIIEPLDGRQGFHVPRVELGRGEILLVAANGPRGDIGRRTKTRAHAVSLQVGPYLVEGYLHALPGADPLANLHRRAAMLPLTDATVEYRVGDAVRRDTASVLIVNRERIRTLSPAVAETARSLDLPSVKSVDPRVKDFTGELSAGHN